MLMILGRWLKRNDLKLLMFECICTCINKDGLSVWKTTSNQRSDSSFFTNFTHPPCGTEPHWSWTPACLHSFVTPTGHQNHSMLRISQLPSLPRIQSGQQLPKNGTHPEKIRPDISTKKYFKYHNSKCVDPSVKTQAWTTKTVCPLQKPTTLLK